MDGTPEWRPGPLEALVEQERWSRFLAGLTARQRAVLEAALDGRGTGEIAARQGVSAGAVGQLRRRRRRVISCAA
jgi:DNA-directed RNA polymerase specialized sigma24 family protein